MNGHLISMINPRQLHDMIRLRYDQLCNKFFYYQIVGDFSCKPMSKRRQRIPQVTENNMPNQRNEFTVFLSSTSLRVYSLLPII